jgi:tetratricopeptide (TPR) repeat protein
MYTFSAVKERVINLLYKPFVHILLIAAIGLIAYSNTFHSPFIFDDNVVIKENPIIRDLRFYLEPSRAELFKGTFQYQSFKNRYIGSLTFALNYKLHGLDVFGYHIVNLAVHLLNALLLYLLIVFSFKTPYLRESQMSNYSKQAAFFISLFFACHPIQTEAVTYIWQRVTSLATMFYLFSFLLYIKARFVQTNAVDMKKRVKAFPATGLICYIVSLLSAVLAMKTKQISFTLPIMMVLYEFMFFQGNRKKRILFLMPFLLTMLIIPLSLMDFDKPLGEFIGALGEIARDRTEISRLDYLFTQFRVIITYMRLIFIPLNQNIAYDYPVYNSLFDVPVILSFAALLLLFGLAVYLYSRSRRVAGLRMVSLGIFWFFLALSIESSIIPILGVIYEHRLYLPSIGVFIAAITSLFIMVEKLRHRWKGIDRVVMVVLFLMVIVLSGATYARNAVWKSRISIWEDAVKKSPERAETHYNLGLAYQSQGFIDKAINQYQIATELKKDYTEAYVNLGVAYKSEGLTEKAIEQYRIAVRLNPGIPEIHNNLGAAYMSQGLIEKAIEQYQTAIKIKPSYAKAHYNLGNAYKAQGDLVKASEHYQIAIKLSYK